MTSSEYFDELLSGIETESLPLADKKSNKKSFSEYKHKLNIESGFVKKLCTKYNITENTLFNAVFSIVTARFSGANDALYVLANEKTIPVYCKFDENTTLSDYLTQLEKQIESSLKNALPFEELTKKYNINTDLVFSYNTDNFWIATPLTEARNDNPLHPTPSSLHSNNWIATAPQSSALQPPQSLRDSSPTIRVGASSGRVEALGQPTTHHTPLTTPSSAWQIPHSLPPNYKLAVSVVYNEKEYSIIADYRSDLYEKASIINILQSYEAALTYLTKCHYVKDISILSKEQEAELDKFNNTEAEFDSSKTVVDMFCEVASKYPKHTAVVYKNMKISYAKLDKITSNLAGYLINSGYKAEDVIAVLIPRSEYMAIVSMGAAKSGCAYQPLDPTYPQDRLHFMLRDSGAKLLITTRKMQSLVPEYTGKVLYIDEIASLPDYKEELPRPNPKNLFILLYTSGSTGIPKGCMLEYGNISAFCNNYRLQFKLDTSSKTTAYASYGFDASMMDIFCPLTSGAELHIIPEEIRLDLVALNSYFVKNGITHAFMTTQVGRQFALGIKNTSLKYLLTGGEKLVPLEPPKEYKLINLYGPTEATVFITNFQVNKYYENIPIGKPVSNVKLYIVDNHGNRLPFGACGELQVAGVQVARGYLKRPEKTKEVFIKNPFSKEKAYKKIYRTGDVVRLLSNGNLSFVGRRDTQVKIRGFRIELTEVEEVIRHFPEVKDATVAAFDDDSGGKYIAAYIVSDKKIDVDALNAFILETKPPYMVPAVTIQIDKIPLNQNHKVNKRALPKPEKKIEDRIKPQNEIQQRIFNCVAEAIGHEDFGITTDFYYAGLTSISSIRLNLLLANEFNVNLKINDLKNNPTVEKLEQFLQKAEKSKTYNIQEVYPLTNTQEGIFIDCTANMGTTLYNLPFLFKLSPKIDLLKLKSAIETVIEAHKYLKVRLFMDKNGEIKQRRNDDEKFKIEIIDGRNISKNELVKPFNLFGERLARFAIYRTHKGSHLFIDIHHLIADGTSYEIILNDIERAYQGEEIKAEKYTSYEAALDNAAAVKSELYAKSEKYYDSIFENCGGNTDFKPNLFYNRQGVKPSLGMLRILGKKLKPEKVKQICKKYGITENIFFNGVFGALLASAISVDKSVFTTIYHGRSDSRLANTVGMLVKTLPVLCDVSKDTDYYFKNLQTQIMGMMNNDLFPFPEISRKYKIVPNAMVVYQGEAFEFDKICGEKAENIVLDVNAAKTPISLEVFLNNDSYRFELEYRSDMYSEEYAQALIKDFENAAVKLANEKHLSDLIPQNLFAIMPCLKEGYKKKHTKKHNINDTAFDFIFEPTPRLFEAQAEQNPDKIAVICNKKSLTYKELNREANKVAHELISRKIGKEDIIGVLLDRGINCYVSQQGILKSGAAFTCISPEYPEDRVRFILEDSSAKYVIVDKKTKTQYADLFKSISTKPLLIDELLKCKKTDNPNIEISENDLCYCIYTSGSTGKPKGVMIEHGNLANFVNANPKNHETLGFTEKGSVVLALAAMTFDVSIMEEFIPLTHGMTVVIATDEEIHNLDLLAKLIKENNVDIVATTPSFLSVMLEIPQMREALKNVNSYDFGAEAFPGCLYDKIVELNPDAYIMNGYGPTETTISCTMKVITGNDNITIGIPNTNVFAYIIDDNCNEVAEGETGELLICGKGVGRGYVNLPDKTAAAFIEFKGMRGYRTGDLARINEDGEIEFHGRKDNQVKLRGLRIELGEVEEAICSYPDVTAAAVIAIDNMYLAAYYTATKDVTQEELTKFISGRLAHYMVPNVYIQLDKMPLTSSRKIDRKALPKPEINIEQALYAAPQTAEQAKLCELYAKALKIEKIGIDDDFFALGGTSLTASKVAVMCLNENIPLVYADIFKYPTIRQLTQAIYGNVEETENIDEFAKYSYNAIDTLLAANDVRNADEVVAGKLGNVLLTGATGFLGIHVLKEFVSNYKGRIYCLVRKGKYDTPDKRLMNMMMYYFDSPNRDLFGNKIICIDGDITNIEDVNKLIDVPFDTLVNCAACVKHFASDETLEKINVKGVENLISLCKKAKKRLIQISTVSVAGEGIDDKPPYWRKIAENDLYFNQHITNEYTRTKFLAERKVLEAVVDGLDAKIIRAGNLMSRNSDGEFQINFITNGFLRTLRGYTAIGAFPMSGMHEGAEFSPIDVTAAAVLKLASTNSKFTVFHACNSHRIYMSDVIYAMNNHGFKINIVSDDEFEKLVSEYASAHEGSEAVSGLIAYTSRGTTRIYEIDYVNDFTTQILYRLGFKWPITDDSYLENAIKALDNLEFFDDENDRI